MTLTACDCYEDDPFILLRNYAIWKVNNSYYAYSHEDGEFVFSQDNLVGTSNNVRHLTQTLIPYLLTLQDEKDRGE